MATDATVVIRDIDSVLTKFEKIKADSKYDDLSDQDDDVLTELGLLLAHTIDRFAPAGSQFKIRADEVSASHMTSTPRLAVLPLGGILRSLKTSYVDGYLQSITELIHADVFADFLEMADYLLTEGYKDAAAVITGGVLEEHLRKLCIKNGIGVIDANGNNKKTATLNDDLARANVYDKLEQKNVTAWLDLRNKAAHGEYGKYDATHVEHLILGIRSFLTRYPA